MSLGTFGEGDCPVKDGNWGGRVGVRLSVSRAVLCCAVLCCVCLCVSPKRCLVREVVVGWRKGEFFRIVMSMEEMVVVRRRRGMAMR